MDNRKSKSILINPQFQKKFLSYSLVISGVTVLVLLVLKFVIFANIESKLILMGLAKDHMIFDFLRAQSRYAAIGVVIAGIFEIGLLTVSGLIISHRVSGPLYRLTQDLNAMADGNRPLKEIKFRKNDFFPEVATAVNRVLFKDKEK